MDNIDTISNRTLSSSELKRPFLPARLFPLGTTRLQKQPSGKPVLFVAVNIKTIYTDVYSKLDEYASDWYTLERRWVPYEGLEDGLEIVQTV